MSTMNKVAKELKSALTESDNKKPKAFDTEAIVTRTESDTLWVKFPGGDIETPVRKTMDAKVGDTIMVRVANHRAWAGGNVTSPPTDDTTAKQARFMATQAGSVAQSALEDANLAHLAANEAWEYADSAHTAANNAWDYADEAYRASFAAGIAADSANTFAQQAAADATTAREEAELASNSAAQANQAATDARGAAEDAAMDASRAHDSAIIASNNAATAEQMASQAAQHASEASGKAEEAADAARTANIASSGAISSLSIVEDVLGALNWISEHATYKPTEDTFVIPGKYYFERSDNTYSPIVPAEDANPKASGLYEIDSITEGVSNYVATHLALANEGLYIQTIDGDATSRMLVSPDDGVILYGPNGQIVAKYGDSAIIGNENDLHIKIDNNEVGFYDGETEVAYINQQRLYITQSVVLDNMMIGEDKWIWKYDDRDDSIILKWIG